MNKPQSILEVKIYPGDALSTGNWASWWKTTLLPIGLPLLGALILGPLVAYLLARDNVLFASILAVLIPVGILFIKYPFIGLMIWVALVPFLPYSRVSMPVNWVLHRALIPLAIGIVILSAMLRIRKLNLRLGFGELATLVFMVIIVISTLLTQNDVAKILPRFFDRLFIPLAAYWLVRLFSPGEKDLKRFVPIMLVLCWAECIIGLLSWFAPHTLPEIWIFSQQGTRTTGTLGNPAAYTGTLMFLMLFLLHYAVNQKNRFMYGLIVLTFGLGLACIFFSFSRGSWLSAVLVLIVLLFVYPKLIVTTILLTLPVMIVLSTTILAGEITYAYERLNTEGTIDSRRILAHSAEQMFLAKPIFGWGYETYDLHDWKFMERTDGVAPSKWDIQRGTSHNTYLTILAELGIVGLFSYFFPLLWWLYLSIKAWPRMPSKGYWSRQLLIIMWLYIGFQCLVSQFMDMRFFLFPPVVLWLVLGLIGNLVQPYLNANRVGNAG